MPLQIKENHGHAVAKSAQARQRRLVAGQCEFGRRREDGSENKHHLQYHIREADSTVRIDHRVQQKTLVWTFPMRLRGCPDDAFGENVGKVEFFEHSANKRRFSDGDVVKHFKILDSRRRRHHHGQ